MKFATETVPTTHLEVGDKVLFQNVVFELRMRVVYDDPASGQLIWFQTAVVHVPANCTMAHVYRHHFSVQGNEQMLWARVISK